MISLSMLVFLMKLKIEDESGLKDGYTSVIVFASVWVNGIAAIYDKTNITKVGEIHHF